MSDTSQKWASLHNHSCIGSLLDAVPHPVDLVRRAVELDLTAIALSDHGTCNGLVKMAKARKSLIDEFKLKIEYASSEEEKEKFHQYIERTKSIHLINAIELYVKVEEKVNSHLVILAKNKQGYRDLIKLCSEATRRDNFYRKPRLSLSQIASFNEGKNLFAFSGHIGSDMADQIFASHKDAYSTNNYEEAKSFIHTEWKKRIFDKADEYIQTFGKDNFALEIQLIDQDRMPAQVIVARTLRWLSKQLGIPCISSGDTHYLKPENAEDQRVLLCNRLKTTIPKMYKQISSDEDDSSMSGFFKTDRYYLHSADDIYKINSESEIKYTLEVAESIEDYDLYNPPIIPIFPCPNNLSSDEYMKNICREGWKEKLIFTEEHPKDEYVKRIKMELETLQGAKLSDYFLIIQDFISYIKSKGFLVNPGRGSAGGCLTSYLMGITAIDPIPPGLIFERFYNAGRNAPGKPASLPDIDCDIQGAAAEVAVKYLRDKYGHENVGQIGTYGRLMAKACMKDVLRAYEACDATTANKICSFLIDESAISDELQEMKEEDEEGKASIIDWALQNNAKELREWAWITPDKDIEGPFAKYFKCARRLEGTYRQPGKHAAGYVIYPNAVTDICPVIYDDIGDCQISYDMHDVEYTGGVKIDVLKVWALDKVNDCAKDIRMGFLRNIYEKEISN